MANELWEKSHSIKSLEAGWHLTRAESTSGFFTDIYHQQGFAQNLAEQVTEIQRLLITQTYRIRPLRQVLAPKGPLATRPRSHLPLRDKVVFWSVVKNIAPELDKALSENIYSYRLKKNPKKGELFLEGDALELPFLKKKDISIQLDPFEPWYDAWPDFEERTKKEIGLGFDHLVVSDIAAYFENINIELLKDLLMSLLDNEPMLCNFITDGFSRWTSISQLGARPKRGIPQGTGISSFFGNLYLLPVDQKFESHFKNRDVKYIRYMDDIRVFTKSIEDARESVFVLESAVRDLHLNLQNAKTKVLVEKPRDKQISNFLFDDRVESIGALRANLDKKEISDDDAISKLYTISRADPLNPNSSKLHLVTNPKSDLTDRAMRGWMNQSIRVLSDNYIPTILRQFKSNPDQRLSRIFVNTCRAFPRHSTLGNSIKTFFASKNHIHSHQEAELFRASRYLSVVPEEIWDRALDHILKEHSDFQLRIQSLLLLGMRSHNKKIFKEITNQLSNEKDIIVQPYYFSVLGQLSGEKLEEISRRFLWHPNSHNQEFGLMLKKLEKETVPAKKFISYAFSNDVNLTDWQGILFFLAESNNPKIREELLKHITVRRQKQGRTVLKDRLFYLRKRVVWVNEQRK